MVGVFYYLGLLRGDASVYTTIQEALSAYNQGKFDMAENIFYRAEDTFLDNESFQSDYFSFLIKMGKYERVLKYSNTCKLFNKHYITAAKEYLEVLQSGDRERISRLVDVSPNSYEIMVVAAEHSLQQVDYAKFNRCVSKASQLRPDSEKIAELQARQRCMIGRYEAGIELFRRAKLGPQADLFAEIVVPFRELASSGPQDASSYSSYERLYSGILVRKSRDPYRPSIYNHILQAVLSKLLMLGVAYKKAGVYMYAERLLDIDCTQDVAFLTVKAAIIDEKPVGLVSELFEKHKDLLNEARRMDLRSSILLYEKRQADRRREQEDEQRRRQQQQQRQRQQQQQQRQRQQQQQQRQRQQQQQQRQQAAPTSRAGTDFLGYYETLKLPRTAKASDIKRAHKKAFRMASRVKDDEERDTRLKAVNKAQKVLSDEKTRHMYDQGIDPDNPHEFRQQNFYGQGGGNTFIIDEMDINDIFGSFFGGGHGSRFSATRGGGRRAQYFYFG